MPFLTSANIACGFHGGDPHVMRSTVALAVQHGVGVGAHVAFPDLIGFGRRRLAATAEEIQDYVVYQAGAIRAFVEAAGGRLQHVKPHGALSRRSSTTWTSRVRWPRRSRCSAQTSSC